MVNAGIIGCGRVAWKWDDPKDGNFNTHAKSYYKNRGVRLKACCDIRFSEAKGLARIYGAAPYRDYSEMLKSDPLDVVSVCTPVGVRYRILKHILTETDTRYILAEKPLVSNIGQVRDIMRLAKIKKAYIAVNYIRRHDKTLNRLKVALSSGALGRYLFGRFVYYGSFAQNGVHIADLMDFLGLGRASFDRLDGGGYASLEGRLYFEKGMVRIGDYSDARIYAAAPSETYPDFRELKLKKSLPATITTAMRRSVNDIVERCRKGRRDYASLERELELMRLAHETER